MAPKVRFTKDAVIQSALSAVRELGPGGLNAREIAKRLGCSTSPLFTMFGSMDEIEKAVAAKAQELFTVKIIQRDEYTPGYRSLGMNWISFAETEKELYRLLFLGGSRYGIVIESLLAENYEAFRAITEEIMNTFGLERNEASKVLNEIIVFSSGVAALGINGGKHYSKNELGVSLSESYLGTVFFLKAAKRQLNAETAERIAAVAT